MYSTIGTCSCCGGPVQVPDMWGGVVEPTPKCGQCGAVAKKSYGPVIDMQPTTRGYPQSGYVAYGVSSNAARQGMG